MVEDSGSTSSKPVNPRVSAQGWLQAQAKDGSWREAIARAGLIWIVFTALRWFVGLVAEFVQPDHGRLVQGFPVVFDLFGHFDTYHFFEISKHGYFYPDAPPEKQAFFPGYPLLLSALARLFTLRDPTNESLLVAGTVVSLVCSLIATVMVYRIARDQFGTPAASLAAVLLMTWPSAVFLGAVYSESLYLALATSAWWCATKGYWWGVGVLCAGASFTRINGLFLIAALLVMMILQVRRRGRKFDIRAVLALGFGAAGAGGYLIYLWVQTGDPLAWQHTQYTYWGRETVWPWTALTNTVELSLTESESKSRRFQWAVDMAVAVMGVAATAYLGVRRLWPEFTLALITFSVLLSSTYYLSIARSTLTIFPLFVVGGFILARQSLRVSFVVLTASGLWMAFTTVLFTLNRWSG